MIWQPLWQFYESQGIDASSLTSYPLQGPQPLTPEQLAWRVAKAASRVQRTIEQAESGRKVPRAFQEKEVWRHIARAKQIIRFAR
jgi:hypothetical protein